MTIGKKILLYINTKV